MPLEFDSYEDLLRSINIAESLESIPPVMFEVYGTVLDAVPERNTARVYRTPRTDGVGMGNPMGTSRAVDALNGARTVFQTEGEHAILVRDDEAEGPAEEPERDDIEDCTTEPGDEIISEMSETVVGMEEETGSPTGEVVDDFAEVFQLPTITGEEDEEMTSTDVFSPEEVIETQADDVSTQEDNDTNEAGILDFLASVAEHSKESTTSDNGDILDPNDYEMEFSRSPFKVIDEHYGGRYRGRGLWGHYFRSSHALACRHYCNRNCYDRYHPPGSPINPCMHPHAKYYLHEEKLIGEIVEKKMEPWQRAPSTMYNTMVYRAGDLRDIYDDTEVQKSQEERRAAMERLEIIKNAKGPMLRSQLVAEVCTALLAAGSAKGYTFHKVADEPGPSSSTSMPASTKVVKDRTVNRSQGHLSVRVLNLGNWERSRKRSTPQCFHHLIDWEGTYKEHKADPTAGNLFLHFLSNMSAHVLLLQEASTIRQLEKNVLEGKGWMLATSPDRTLLCAIRANPWPGSYVRHIAGTRTIKRSKETPLTCAIFECCFGDEPSREEWERAGLSNDKVAQRDLLKEDNPNKDKINRAGLHVIRTCSFHLDSSYAMGSPALCGGLLSSMVADYVHYQVDIIGGDGNSSAYRFGGSNENSSSNEQSLLQEVFKSFRDAYISCQEGDLNVSPKLRFTSGNTTENLRYFETNFGRPWNEIVDRYPSDAPEGDCMVACIIEWGHSQSLDKWSNHPPADYEYIVNVSEFLMYAGLETLFLGPRIRTATLFSSSLSVQTAPLIVKKDGMFHSLRRKSGTRTEEKDRKRIDRRARPKTLLRAGARPRQRS